MLSNGSVSNSLSPMKPADRFRLLFGYQLFSG